ncbi:MAG: dienelactone hydrolase family protein [Chitinophagaceae bacterium]|nr:dienelactone hydrolase family protein [Chitinophagaceae bacterium]MEA3427328.1 dienelactone hydrolase family protein [Bacteroidota bacterium]MCA6453206.1 dienelactone hydrolase family protein [Chitinophagaceae bacterium]MCA6454786.1 dienelactone hydrolase family protein [Chitinophagaceae bacterium]MCA6459421.1 dienelactone hydrolase family protein [Chitinophagaceae bacterium]
MDQRIINLYDEYTHRPLSREVFLKRLAAITGSMALALSITPLLESNHAKAATIAEDDDELDTEMISYEVNDIVMFAYTAKPKKKMNMGAVMVIHENRGLNDHIKDVTRRLAKAGYLAMAPDALSEAGGTPANEDEARRLFTTLDTKKNLDNFVKSVEFLRARKETNRKVGCVGFCWGGALANQIAISSPKLNAAVSFYGRQPDPADVPKIKAPLQLHYAGLDERVNAGIPAFEEALKKAGIRYELYLYPGVNHAFHNDTSEARYNADAALHAWKRTLDFFEANLK